VQESVYQCVQESACRRVYRRVCAEDYSGEYKYLKISLQAEIYLVKVDQHGKDLIAASFSYLTFPRL
jgi:hypothetical protein